MLFPLLRDEVALCDLHLFLVGVAGKLDNLHPVQKRTRDGIKRVCGGDEKHFGQIEGYLKEVVAEAAVLLPVERLKQRSTRVSAVVGAELVYLVEHHEGVARTRLNNTGDDAPRHGADVGAPVAANLRLVVYAAERDADKLSVDRPCNALRDAGLAGARRAYKAQKSAFYLAAYLLYGEIFKDALFDLFKPIMLVVEDFPRLCDIDGLLSIFAPGDFKAGVEIPPYYSRLRGTEGLL